MRTVLLMAAAALVGFAPPQVAERPNILFIFTDDHAPHAIGAYGSKINKTPNIDRIAREGILFRNSFCTNSICGPSRAVIQTGKHSHLNGMPTNSTTFDGSQVTFPKLLQKAGYQTAVIGKWHLVSEPTGFDFWSVLQGQGPYYNPLMLTSAGRVNHTGYTTDVITELSLEWLRTGRDKSKPFLLMSQHKAPHREWQPAPRHLTLFDDVTIPEPATLFDDWSGRTSAAKKQTMTIERDLNDLDLKMRPPGNLTPDQLEAWKKAYEPKNEAMRKANLQGKDLVRWKYQRYIKDYLRCVTAVDEGIGRLLQHLDESGLAKNTIVVYSSDQGFYLGDHGWFDKRWMYEESLKMPLIVRWPGVTKPGSEDRHLVQNLDYAPTFLRAAGVEPPAEMQGLDLGPLLRGQGAGAWRKSIYYHYYELPGPHTVQRHYGVRTERHKLIHYYPIKEWELFDLEKDPDELRSVHDEPAYAPVRKELEAELKRLQQLYGDTNPEGPIPSRSPAAPPSTPRKGPDKLEKALQLEKPDGRARQDIDPSGGPFAAGARCTPEAGDGVIVAQGGGSMGFSLYLKGGIPRFAVRNDGTLVEAVGKEKLATGKETHLAGVVGTATSVRLYVDGRLAAEAKGHFIARKPADALTVGSDGGSLVGDYTSPMLFKGTLSDIRVYLGPLDEATLRAWAGAP